MKISFFVQKNSGQKSISMSKEGNSLKDNKILMVDGLSAFNATAAKNRSQTSKEEDSYKVSWAQTKKKEAEKLTERKKGRNMRRCGCCLLDRQKN